MTDLRKAAEMALEALTICLYHGDGRSDNDQSYLPPRVRDKTRLAIAALEQASQILAQSEKKQTHSLVHEIDLVLSDPESDLSEGAKRALRYVGKQLQAQPEQEPIAYLCENAVGYKYFRWKKPTSHYKPIALYTASPPKPWVGLTDDEIDYIFGLAYADDMELLRTIEAKLKDKNG